MKDKDFFTGYSQVGIDEAIENALVEAGEYTRCEVIETYGSQDHTEQRHYQVTLSTCIE